MRIFDVRPVFRPIRRCLGRSRGWQHEAHDFVLRAHSKKTSIGRRFIPSGSVVKTRTTQMFLRFCALPDRRFNSQNCELIFS